MKAGQGQNTLIPEMFEKRAALFILEFSGRAFPLEKFAEGFGQLGEAEAGEITNRLTNELELGRGKITAGKGNLLSGMAVLLFFWFSYLIRKRRECPA
jgi:hypothetical protein